MNLVYPYGKATESWAGRAGNEATVSANFAQYTRKLSAACEISLASQTQLQPTPAPVTFSITHVRDTENDPRWGWLGLVCETTCGMRLQYIV